MLGYLSYVNLLAFSEFSLPQIKLNRCGRVLMFRLVPLLAKQKQQPSNGPPTSQRQQIFMMLLKSRNKRMTLETH